jgi:hypothetical protein
MNGLLPALQARSRNDGVKDRFHDERRGLRRFAHLDCFVVLRAPRNDGKCAVPLCM